MLHVYSQRSPPTHRSVPGSVRAVATRHEQLPQLLLADTVVVRLLETVHLLLLLLLLLLVMVLPKRLLSGLHMLGQRRAHCRAALVLSELVMPSLEGPLLRPMVGVLGGVVQMSDMRHAVVVAEGRRCVKWG